MTVHTILYTHPEYEDVVLFGACATPEEAEEYVRNQVSKSEGFLDADHFVIEADEDFPSMKEWDEAQARLSKEKEAVEEYKAYLAEELLDDWQAVHGEITYETIPTTEGATR